MPLGSKAEQDSLVIAKPTNEEEVAMFKAEVARWICEIASSRTSFGKATDNGLASRTTIAWRAACSRPATIGGIVKLPIGTRSNTRYVRIAILCGKSLQHGSARHVFPRLEGLSSFYAGYCRRTLIDLPTT